MGYYLKFDAQFIRYSGHVTVRHDSLQRYKLFIQSMRLGQPRKPTNSYPVSNGNIAVGVKLPAHEANHSPQTREDVKNAWNCTSNPHYVFTHNRDIFPSYPHTTQFLCSGRLIINAHVLYVTLVFIAVYTTARHWYTSWGNLNPFNRRQHYFLKINFNIILVSTYDLPNRSLPLCLPTAITISL